MPRPPHTFNPRAVPAAPVTTTKVLGGVVGVGVEAATVVVVVVLVGMGTVRTVKVVVGASVVRVNDGIVVVTVRSAWAAIATDMERTRTAAKGHVRMSHCRDSYRCHAPSRRRRNASAPARMAPMMRMTAISFHVEECPPDFARTPGKVTTAPVALVTGTPGRVTTAPDLVVTGTPGKVTLTPALEVT